jgi:hypothetical protein
LHKGEYDEAVGPLRSGSFFRSVTDPGKHHGEHIAAGSLQDNPFKNERRKL